MHRWGREAEDWSWPLRLQALHNIPSSPRSHPHPTHFLTLSLRVLTSLFPGTGFILTLGVARDNSGMTSSSELLSRNKSI